jgi:poly(hydroxyalkanoate) granule-associated protein
MGKSKQELKASARKIWLAGLGAMATAEKEGTKLFNALVAAGKDIETEPLKKAGRKVKGTLKQLRSEAGKAIDNIESGFDEQVTSALKRMGVPTQKEVAALNKKIAKLEKALEKSKRASKTSAPTTKAKKKVAKKKKVVTTKKAAKTKAAKKPTKKA